MGDGRLIDLRYWKSFLNLASAWEGGTLPTMSFHPRAARQLFHVFGEGLGAELEPLDHGEVREELIGKVRHRQAVTDSERRRLDHLAALSGQGPGPRAAARSRARRRA
jgi:hypothetical protein